MVNMKLNSGAGRNEIFYLPSAIPDQIPKVIQFLKKKQNFKNLFGTIFFIDMIIINQFC